MGSGGTIAARYNHVSHLWGISKLMYHSVPHDITGRGRANRRTYASGGAVIEINRFPFERRRPTAISWDFNASRTSGLRTSAVNPAADAGSRRSEVRLRIEAGLT